jgi:hypothetical protein
MASVSSIGFDDRKSALCNGSCSREWPLNLITPFLIRNRLLSSNHKYSLAHSDRITREIRDANSRGLATDPPGLPSTSSQGGIDIDAMISSLHISDPPQGTSSTVTIDPASPKNHGTDLLGWKMGQASLLNDPNADADAHSDMNFLLADDSEDSDGENKQFGNAAHTIRNAPLIDAGIMSSNNGSLLPQYGLLGSHGKTRGVKSKLFLNTTVPFSMFLCGVQGSGKSHTTSCILENSLISSGYLGKLRNPLSALVFSYAQFSGDGIGFTVSEAAFLASPDSRLPVGAHVKKVHVLVSPSNFVRISKLYLRLPNVLVTPFKLKPQDLDIDTMLTLMNVSESDETPLYMAQVTQILREMSTSGDQFDYKAFKMHLKKKDFNPTQSSMLKMRLDLLESFLDMNLSVMEPQFQPGEITIMDMSCPFVDANTACILFRVGLKRYLQSKAKGKMIVLDEAHKVRCSSTFGDS